MRLKIKLFASFLVLTCLLPTVAVSRAKKLSIALVKSKDAYSYNETSIGYLKYFKTIGYKEYAKKDKKYFKKKRMKIEVKEFDLKGDVNNAEKLIHEINDKPYDLVVTLGRRAFDSMKGEIHEIPIVFATMFNPYNGGGEPKENGSNIAGVQMDIPYSTQFEVLGAFIPFLQNIGVIYSDTPENKLKIQKAMDDADKLKLTLVPYIAKDEKEVAKALDKLMKETDALWMIPDRNIYSKDTLKYIILQTIENEFPFMGLSKAYVKAGALFTVSWDFQDIGQQAAMISHDIMAGAPPSKEKVRPLRKYPIYINKRTAESIDIRIPQWISEKTVEFYD